MEEFQIKAIFYHIKDLERKVLITSHVTKALPQNQRQKVDREKDVSDKLRKLIEILRKSKDGFSQFLRALSKEKQSNDHLVKKLKSKAQEIQREEKANHQEQPKTQETAKFVSTDVQKCYQDVSQALNGKCDRKNEEFELEKFTDVVVEINTCKLQLSPNDGNIKNISLRSLISEQEKKHRLEKESMKKQQEDVIEDLQEQLRQKTEENEELHAQMQDMQQSTDSKIKQQVAEEVRRRLLKPPTGGKYYQVENNSGEDTDNVLSQDVGLPYVDEDRDEEEEYESLIDLEGHDLSQYDKTSRYVIVKNININAKNVNLGTNPIFKDDEN